MCFSVNDYRDSLISILEKLYSGNWELCAQVCVCVSCDSCLQRSDWSALGNSILFCRKPDKKTDREHKQKEGKKKCLESNKLMFIFFLLFLQAFLLQWTDVFAVQVNSHKSIFVIFTKKCMQSGLRSWSCDCWQ